MSISSGLLLETKCLIRQRLPDSHIGPRKRNQTATQKYLAFRRSRALRHELPPSSAQPIIRCPDFFAHLLGRRSVGSIRLPSGEPSAFPQCEITWLSVDLRGQVSSTRSEQPSGKAERYPNHPVRPIAMPTSWRTVTLDQADSAISALSRLS